MATDILLGKHKQLGARNETNNLEIDIKTTFKPVLIKDIKHTLDLYDVYRQEYAACRRYRITLTIKPYCTNVLYNLCTEIVKDEGSPKCCVITDSNQAPTLSDGSVFGKTNNLYRNYMVSNTEYSSQEIGYEYLPGYDIFDNHTLRSLSFRPIMKVSGSNEIISTRPYFNTIRDYMRDENGTSIYFKPRFSDESIENNLNLKMHIYEHSNLLSFIDGSSSEANLVVENGWYGFVNASSFANEEVKMNADGRVIGDTHIFKHTLNNSGNCDFIDMFPGRDRYSFVPLYNKFKKRYEKNWDVFLTYPWKNFYNHNLVKNVTLVDSQTLADGKTYALSTMRVLWTNVSTNRRTMLFRMFCKHGVTVNDKVAIYLSKNDGSNYKRLPRTYTVDYIGDINGENAEYFFGISEKMFLNDLFSGDIISKFYKKISNSVDANYIVSHSITEVPMQVSDIVIRVYGYEQISDTSQVFDESTTYDSMPKTVNSMSPDVIRVWKNSKTYTYMVWDYENSTYVIPDSEPVAEYGDWNTFTDIPDVFTTECIRVKQYNFYQKSYENYVLKDEIRNGSTTIENIINDLFDNSWHIRFVRTVNDVDCQYYIREFRKVPNLKYSEEPLPSGLSLNTKAYEAFIERNATDADGKMIEFDSETYKLAFARTLYGDDVVQMTFLDNIVLENLTDNLGRPITSIYSTIVKRNTGYKFWYDDGDNEEIEFSRCFGSVTSGLEYLDIDDTYDRSRSTRILKGFMSSATSIYRDNSENVKIKPLTLEDWDKDRNVKEILETDNVFFGDVVEYNPSQCVETVLSDVCFRFNTAQRELGRDTTDFNFTYTELETDDFDPIRDNGWEPFKAVTYKQWLQSGDNSDCVVDTEHKISVKRKEGYFYHPHTEIPLRKFTEKVYQGSHRSLRIKDCRPIQSDTILIKITTETIHGVGESTTLYLFYNNVWCPTSVSYVIDDYTFTILPLKKSDSERNGFEYLDWVTLCKKVMSGEVKIRVKNDKIPTYASRIGDNLFMWRDIVNPVDLPMNDKYRHQFSNNAYYIDSTANLYLRRQDPLGVNGLFGGDIGETLGTLLPEPNNKYKTVNEIKCY